MKFVRRSKSPFFVEYALCERSVAEVHRRDAARLTHLMGKRAAHSDGNASTHDAVRTEHAHRKIGHVHGAAAALTQTLTLTHDLEKEQIEIHTLGQGMTMTAMVGRKCVLIRQRSAYADRDGFLSNTQMDEAGNLTIREQLAQLLLGLANQLHPPIQRK